MDFNSHLLPTNIFNGLVSLLFLSNSASQYSNFLKDSKSFKSYTNKVILASLKYDVVIEKYASCSARS